MPLLTAALLDCDTLLRMGLLLSIAVTGFVLAQVLGPERGWINGVADYLCSSNVATSLSSMMCAATLRLDHSDDLLQYDGPHCRQHQATRTSVV